MKSIRLYQPRAARAPGGHYAAARAPGGHYALAPYVVAAVHGTEMALLDMRAERYYTLDAVGTRVWELLGAGRSADQIAIELEEEFDAPLSTIECDLRVLLDRLEEASLIIPRQHAVMR